MQFFRRWLESLTGGVRGSSFVLTVKVWGKFIVTQVVCVSDCGCERQIFRAELGLIKADNFLPSVLRTVITT